MAHKNKDAIILVCVLVHASFEIDCSNRRNTKYLIENVLCISTIRRKTR